MTQRRNLNLASCVAFIAFTVISTPSLAAQDLAGDAKVKADQSLQVEEQVPAKEDKQAEVNPFTGKELSFENLEGQLKTESIKAQIQQAKYKRARFANQTQELLNAQPASGSSEPDDLTNKLQQRLASVQRRMHGMSEQIEDFKKKDVAGSNENDQQAHAAPPKKDRPQLVAIVDDNAPGVQGLIVYDHETHAVKVGDNFGPYAVRRLSRKSAVLNGHGKKMKLELANAPGHMPVRNGNGASVEVLGGGTASVQNVDSSLRSQAQRLSRRASR